MKKYDQRLYHILWYSPGTLVPSEDDGGGSLLLVHWKEFRLTSPSSARII